MENETYTRTKICELCGEEFTITQTFSRAKRCPKCAIVIRNGRIEAYEEKKRIHKKHVGVSKLDTLAREAKSYGLSYGQYVTLKWAGYKIRPVVKDNGVNLAWKAWKDEIYGIVEACKARAEHHA